MDAGHVADFVQKHGAGVGLLEFAGLGDVGAGERALLVAEQLALHQIFGDRGAVDLDERPVRARRMLMDRARDHVLAHAAFPAQQHRGAGGRHARDGGENLLHRRAAADDVVELVALAQLLAQLAILVAQLADFQRLFHHGHQVIERKRLGQKIDRAGLHGLHRVFDGAERGHDDHGRVRVLAAQFVEQLQAVHAGQLQIGEDQVGASASLQAFLGGAGLLDFVAGGGQMQLDHAAELFFVFDHQDGGLHALGLSVDSRNGRNTRNTLPSPGSLSTVIVPPCSSTIFETIARPRPTPSILVVKNGLKMLSRFLGSMPEPRSITAISTGPVDLARLHRDAAVPAGWPARRSAADCRSRAPSIGDPSGRAECRANSSCRWQRRTADVLRSISAMPRRSLRQVGVLQPQCSGRAKSRKRVISELVRSTSEEMNPAISARLRFRLDDLAQHFGRSFHGAQRIAQLVRQAGGELAQRGQPFGAAHRGLGFLQTAVGSASCSAAA